MFRWRSLPPALFGLGMLCTVSGCENLWHRVTGRGLSRGGDASDELGAQAPPQSGPRLGALADFTPIFDKPARKSRKIGWLHAGAQVARSAQPVSKQECPEGWYAIYPRGFVCVGQGATTDLTHPTLLAMSLSPKLNEALPYPYAQARVATEVFAPNTEPDDGVHPIARLRPSATFAVVGSWQALDETDQRQKLALMTQGTFVRVDDLKAARLPARRSVELTAGTHTVPIAFVVSDHAKSWRLNGDEATPIKPLTLDTVLSIGQRTRILGDARYYALEDGNWIQQADVVMVRRRNDWPDYAVGNRHWVDLDLDQGTVVLYEAERAVFAALALSVPKNKGSLALGPTSVATKYVTDKTLDPRSLDSSHEVYDVPWVVQLSNGLRIHGAFRQDRGGAALSAARVELTPEDAQRVWAWVEPKLPEGWHAVTASNDASRRTEVLVR